MLPNCGTYTVHKPAFLTSRAPPPQSARLPRGYLRPIRQRHHHDRVARRRAHRRTHAASGAHFFANPGLARLHLNRPRHGAPFRAHRAERTRIRQTRHGLNPRHSHFQRLVGPQHTAPSRRLACLDTRRVLAHHARSARRINHRRPRRLPKSRRCVDNRAHRARRHALIAPRAPGQKRHLVDRSRRPMDRQREPSSNRRPGVRVRTNLRVNRPRGRFERLGARIDQFRGSVHSFAKEPATE